ncbi:hypothetical protein Mpe_A0383 [Methylibium petroleiphilum PM1]|uniref:Transmembrane protein n=1 Tax=Methylibium petroleiphilum (strain ATCC BAA-1232 / LMG 22953 / PM1) TaxID=420662 RepID=A2SCQ6_METPP|nr:hypothetical protein Mpe_A0383 [Methylibium petroleiphilum PM1]
MCRPSLGLMTTTAVSPPTVLRVLRWTSLLVALAVGLFFLNDAFFSAWVAGGPPSEHKLGWERRSQGSLAFALASLFAGAFLFRALVRLPKPGRLSWFLAAVAILLAAAPLVAREVLIDKCLDSGGRWNNMFIECER